MCRLAAYVGESPVSLAALLYDPPHSLEHVAYAPDEMLTGHVNMDGTGVAWWPEGSSRPLRYVTAGPPWSDPNLPNLARHLVGAPVLAAVRSATPGMPYGPDNVAPFVDGDLAGCHNGWIGGFKGGLGRRLSLALSDERFGRLAAVNDSLVLFSLVAQLYEDRPGSDLADSVAETIEDVAKEVVAAGERAPLNLVVASQGQVVATRTSVDFGVNSLYVREDGQGVWLASEPLDNVGEWSPVPEGSLAELTLDGVSIRKLDHAGGPR